MLGVSGLKLVLLQSICHFCIAANANLNDYISFYGGVNVIDSEIKANSVRTDSVGNKSPYTPDYTINAGIQVQYPVLSEIDLLLRADFSRIGPTWMHVIQDNPQSSLFGPANYDRTQRDAYNIVNLRVGMESNNWTITGFAKIRFIWFFKNIYFMSWSKPRKLKLSKESNKSDRNQIWSSFEGHFKL